MQIVDLATLTGACVVALGPSIAGMYIIMVTNLVVENLFELLCVSETF